MTQQKKKGNGCLLIFLWILLFPIMAIITIAKSKKIKTPVKAILITFICIFCVSIAAGSDGENDDTETEGTSEMISETGSEWQSEEVLDTDFDLNTENLIIEVTEESEIEELPRVESIGRFPTSYYSQEVGDSIEFTVYLSPAGLFREDIDTVNENVSVLQIVETFLGDEGENTVFKFTATAIAAGQTKLTIKSADGQVSSNTLSFTITEKDTSRTVYITPTGEKYHYSSACAGKNAIETTLNKARESGYEACKKCAH